MNETRIKITSKASDLKYNIKRTTKIVFVYAKHVGRSVRFYRKPKCAQQCNDTPPFTMTFIRIGQMTLKLEQTDNKHSARK